MMKKPVLRLMLIALGLTLTSCDYIQSLFWTQSYDEKVIFAKSSEIKIIASEEKFKFIPEQIVAKPGQILKLKVTNKIKAMPIVFSILKKDQDPVVNAFLGVQAGKMGQWAPPKEHLIWGSKLLGFNESEKIEIRLPKETGEYAFISSYPGHADDLNGSVKVESPQE